MTKRIAAVTFSMCLGLALAGCRQPQNTTTANAATAPVSQQDQTNAFLFSPYKYTLTGMQSGAKVMSTAVTGSPQNVLDALPQGLNALTIAFATGQCGSEQWDGFESRQKAIANIRHFDAAGVYYVVSTGGGGHKIFTCANPQHFLKFVKTYYTPHMLGVDFDIELGQTPAMVDNLVAGAKLAAQHYPDLRFSFTVATFGSDSRSTPDLGNLGTRILTSIRKHDLKHYLINLMVMDYGKTIPSHCVIGENGLCDMGASAIAAAKNLHDLFGVPYNKIELTPMIGRNDALDQIFTLQDARQMAAFVKKVGIAGIHFWAFDRDRDCTTAEGQPGPQCNSYGKADTLGYTQTFLKAFGGEAYSARL